MLAWQSAARGLHDDARRALERARALVDRAGTTGVAAHLAITAAFCALCRGDLAETVALLEARIAADGGVGSMGEPLGVAPTLVEAYVGLGRLADAAALADRYAAVTPQPPRSGDRRPGRPLPGARPPPTTSRRRRPSRPRWPPTPRPRTSSRPPGPGCCTGPGCAAPGGGSPPASSCGPPWTRSPPWTSPLWAQRAADELAATGATARPRRPLAAEPLTSQETRVALLVARGLSNREVAAALFLSPKTIEHHLASVFRKRGFRSRTELAAAFATASTAQD